MMKCKHLGMLLVIALMTQSMQAEHKKLMKVKKAGEKIGKVAFYSFASIAGVSALLTSLELFQRRISLYRKSKDAWGVDSVEIGREHEAILSFLPGGYALLYGLRGLNHELHITTGIMHGAKKVVEGIKSRRARAIGWNLAQLAAGGAMIFYHTPLSFRPRRKKDRFGNVLEYSDGHGSTYPTQAVLDSSASPFDHWHEYVTENRGYAILTTLFGLRCCYSAITGLNRELSVAQRAKKLWNRMRGHKKESGC